MSIVTINDRLYELDNVVRIELGPVKRHDVLVTEELFADPLMPGHYKLSTVDENGNVTVPQFDADGKIIVMGDTMTFLDWKRPHVWYVYLKNEAGTWVEKTTIDGDVGAALDHAKTFLDPSISLT